MNEQVADTTTQDAGETTDGQDTTQAPASGDPNAGLLERAGTETAPDFTADPSEIADPSKAAAPVERPDHIPKHYWNEKTGKVNEEALAKGYNEIRKQNNKLLADKGADAPENSEDYLQDFKPPARGRATGDQKEGDPLDRFGDVDASNPVFAVMAKAAKNANLSKGQFDDMMQDMMEGIHPLLSEPFDANKEMQMLGENGEHMIDINSSWINRLAKRGVLNENQYNLLLKFGSTAEGVLLTNALRMDAGEKPIPVTASVETGQKTQDECQAMMADPRYNQDGPVGDAFRAEVDKQFALTYGTEPS